MATLAQIIPPFLAQVGGSDRHREDVRALIGNFHELHHWDVEHIRSAQVEQVREQREAKGRDPLKTVQTLKRLIKFAAKEGVPNHWDQVQHVKLRSERRRQTKAGEAVTLEDIDRIRRCRLIEGQQRHAPIFAFVSGQRVRAQQLATWDDLIDWDSDRPCYVYRNDKAGREDIRPASPEFVQCVADYVAECCGGERPSSGLIFRNERGEPWGRFYRWRWSETKRLARVPDADRKRWHDLRSGFVSHLIEQGLSLADVAYLARHTDASLTALRYAHADRNGIAARLAAVAPLVGGEADRLDMPHGSGVGSKAGPVRARATDQSRTDDLRFTKP